MIAGRAGRRSRSASKARNTERMTPFETIETHEMVVACNGDGPLGHPRVYLNLAPRGEIECPYCSRLFVNPAAVRAAADGGGAAGGEHG
jgi:uncharacterized Zn-finger protein